MRKQENYFIYLIHKLLKPRRIYFAKTFNPFRAGLPDVWYSGPKQDLWVEYKFIRSIPKRQFKAPLTYIQHKWLKERYKENRNVAVIIGVYKQGLILTDLQWDKVLTREELKLLSVEQIAEWIIDTVGGSIYDDSKGGNGNHRRII